MKYSLDKNKISCDETGKVYGSLNDFLDNEYDLVDCCMDELLGNQLMLNRMQRRNLEDQIGDHAKSYFADLFNKKENCLDADDLEEQIDSFKKNYTDFGSSLQKNTMTYLDSIFKKKTAGGNEMFKNLKEAKLFTAHLDALASEIENLADVSDDMRTHLAFRLDKLSDLIEKSATAIEHDKDEKYMKDMGDGQVLEGDSDEKSYMKNFEDDNFDQVSKEASALEYDKNEPYLKNVGDGKVLECDADEKSFMKNFEDDDYDQVTKRKTPPAKDGTENDALAIYVKKAMEKLK